MYEAYYVGYGYGGCTYCSINTSGGYGKKCAAGVSVSAGLVYGVLHHMLKPPVCVFSTAVWYTVEYRRDVCSAVRYIVVFTAINSDLYY